MGLSANGHEPLLSARNIVQEFAVRGHGGVKGGVSYGATDEVGFKAVENRVSVHDLHATILHLMGLDDKKLTFKHNSLEQRLTTITVDARVVKEILA